MHTASPQAEHAPAPHIRRISVDALQVGMFIHDLNCDWMDHPFLRNRFPLSDQETLDKIRQAGIREVYIDVDQGTDHPDSESAAHVHHRLHQHLADIAANAPLRQRPVPRHEETRIAKHLHQAANQVISGILDDARLGKQIEIERVNPIVSGMVDSIFRCQDALLPLARLKRHDEYTFQHSVSVCALLIAFARELKLPPEVIHDIGVGGLLHDVGKCRIPDAILNKPGRLTPEEFALMQQHAAFSQEILSKTPGISQIALEVAAQHHERYNGTGYPLKLKENQISLYGQMATIVDVYDAITSTRVYHQPIPPTQALGRLLEWSKFYFKPELVHAFIHAIGIYPTGSLVKLKSQHLAVVTEQSPTDRLRPKVTILYDTRQQCFVPPESLDLSHSQDAIESYQDANALGFEKYLH